ncbi:hypothetical protein BO83DRAFT_31916 [Aspergillus eucalypticola CBS 122712]|uniref:Uncharacterized protein n=1 Tax=Aspergillus eucalypticola (strain CBS 122712 / IBT 29274) TaxID=1448314 RepID=A0A317VHE2_ASPEC|nr:uncharacterized protein BO83DRAFT_31916 [Aspergillus eucalypticola CBS 122712]PWY73325.1 hypothetical protein BO83DRAFT_31916 [Aspergillus eucalypticola CBS 122712]
MMIPVMIVTWFGISIEACLVCHNILGAIDFGARRSSTQWGCECRIFSFGGTNVFGGVGRHGGRVEWSFCIPVLSYSLPLPMSFAWGLVNFSCPGFYWGNPMEFRAMERS